MNEVTKTKTALLVIDMQRDFVEAGPMQVPGGIALADRLGPLLATCRQSDIPIIYTVQAQRPGGIDLGPLASFAPVAEGAVLVEGSSGCEVVPSLKPAPGDAIIQKRRFSAFFGTDLDLLLRSQGIKRLAICGLACHVCCDTTVRDAFQLGYDTILLADGVDMGDLPDQGWGTVTAAEARRVVLTIIAHRFGRVMEIGTFTKLLKEV
jgi:nicotinamidase-related amidase